MRLIDADALKEKLNELRKSPWFETNVNGILERASYTARREALNIVEKLCIDNAPTVERPQGEPVIKCKDCKYQKKYWHKDKRMKEKGYWIYGCELIDDPFIGTPVWGKDNQFCSSAKIKEADNEVN